MNLVAAADQLLQHTQQVPVGAAALAESIGEVEQTHAQNQRTSCQNHHPSPPLQRR